MQPEYGPGGAGVVQGEQDACPVVLAYPPGARAVEGPSPVRLGVGDARDRQRSQVRQRRDEQLPQRRVKRDEDHRGYQAEYGKQGEAG
jgi:hypothetical protein